MDLVDAQLGAGPHEINEREGLIGRCLMLVPVCCATNLFCIIESSVIECESDCLYWTLKEGFWCGK